MNLTSGLDELTSEHILFAHPPIIEVHLSLLFKMLLKHSIVPDGFGYGVVIPLIKALMAIILYQIITAVLQSALLSVSFLKAYYCSCLVTNYNPTPCSLVLSKGPVVTMLCLL